MDSFDDFEMRPLTKGLGFHNRKKLDNEIAEEVKKEIPKSSSQLTEDQELQELMSALDRVSNRLAVSMTDAELKEKQIPQAKETDIEIVHPLPKKSQFSTVHIEPQIPLKENMPPILEREVPQIKNQIKKEISYPDSVVRPTIKTSVSHHQAHGKRRGSADSHSARLQPAVFSFSAAILDTMMVLAVALMFLITLLLVTGVKLAMVFKGVQTDLMTQASMFLLYISVLQLYVIVSRSFFGKTLGEWTFEYQMGDDKQIQSAMYPILVLWRSLVVMATGVVTLPLLSVVFRRDLASFLTGLQFYKKG